VSRLRAVNTTAKLGKKQFKSLLEIGGMKRTMVGYPVRKENVYVIYVFILICIYKSMVNIYVIYVTHHICKCDIYVHIHNGVLFSHKDGGYFVKSKKMDGTGDYHVK
jgi:membrane protein YdbS with pleckstrin-like domain